MGKKAEYGSGDPAFLKYVNFVVKHPAYRGMPDVTKDDGGVQWEAPSNRSGGKFKDTHHKRREWWKAKAVEVGIDPNSAHWISKTAKFIHPTKKKPCKNCGKEIDIRYSYPSHILMKRIIKLNYIDESFPLDPLEHTGLCSFSLQVIAGLQRGRITKYKRSSYRYIIRRHT